MDSKAKKFCQKNKIYDICTKKIVEEADNQVDEMNSGKACG